MTAKHFTNMVQIYSDRLYRYVVKHGIRQIEAEDIVQNCFEALWKSSVEAEVESGKYLFGVAYNQCADYWRRGKRDVLVETMPEHALGGTTEKNSIQTLLHQLLLQLPEEQRSLLILKDYEGYSYAEIADITQLNLSQVKVYLHRARLVMQEKLGSLQKVI
jgi:RNA polymerase sigma factor (sigma-70 family)